VPKYKENYKLINCIVIYPCSENIECAKYVTVFVLATTQVRFAHTDIQVPDFSDYRRDAVKRPAAKSTDSAESRKSFTYLMVGGQLN
jgi:hypothetical protein